MCQCDAGFAGGDCDYPCPDDTFGDGCRNACTCYNGATCHPVTGRCTCALGYMGEM